MAKNAGKTIIKKYANRRLYNTSTSTYVTLEDLACMVKKNEDFSVQDAKTGEDITHSVLTQIIFEQENKNGQNLMPVAFLRQLIRFYGDQMQMMIPTYLEQSMSVFAREQEAFREEATAQGKSPSELMEEQIRRNTELFRDAMAVFNPFMASGYSDSRKDKEPAAQAPINSGEVDELRAQVAEMQKRLEALDGRKSG